MKILLSPTLKKALLTKQINIAIHISSPKLDYCTRQPITVVPSFKRPKGKTFLAGLSRSENQRLNRILDEHDRVDPTSEKVIRPNVIEKDFISDSSIMLLDFPSLEFNNFTSTSKQLKE
ncbi:hypothetical protein [Aliikangiella coralliicola]|uniref:Uncharacterized protein n=1 Tax=Aliikangiella coralliicola TaxID=2592383 RepID=A0A545UB91_9GAMM|nr:hypothetical protein [Aliikangiella coralliicola]TQV86732.1 hypothetical protein FLL46_17735 [Aliikangiella coralliicola]